MKYIIIFFNLILIILSCKKEEIKPHYDVMSNGVINGKIIGLTRDSISINESFSWNLFNYVEYPPDPRYPFIYIEDKGENMYLPVSYGYDLYLARFSNDGLSSISFALRDSSGILNLKHVVIRYYKINTSGEMQYYFLNSIYNNTILLNNLHFDPNTGKLNGKYSLSFSPGLNKNFATVEGSIDVTLFLVKH